MALTPLQVVTNALTTFNNTLASTKKLTSAQLAVEAQQIVDALNLLTVGWQSDGTSKNAFYVGGIVAPIVPPAHMPVRQVFRLRGAE